MPLPLLVGPIEPQGRVGAKRRGQAGAIADLHGAVPTLADNEPGLSVRVAFPALPR